MRHFIWQVLFTSIIFAQTQVQITHLYHSGFIIEYDNRVLIFDYYPAQDLEPNSIQNGYIETKYFSTKQVIVFISHEHKDHFYKDAINWKSSIQNIHYFVSKEVAAKDNRYQSSDYVTIVDHDDQILHKDLRIKTIRSTDSGVAFLVQAPELTLYHSGDHASWNWRNDADANDQFVQSLLSKLGNIRIDVGMHVFDQRLSKAGSGGFFHFIHAFKPVVAIPMHAKGKYFGNLALSEMAKEWGYEDYIWKINSPGEVYRFSIQR